VNAETAIARERPTRAGHRLVDETMLIGPPVLFTWRLARWVAPATALERAAVERLNADDRGARP
jgi:hypothetical protein